MRILAVRGENLASLAEEFEIDLAHGPLGDAGVFAIVGPTGAGKTTLLDAICVALFDRTPRLANRSPFQIGRGDDDPTALGAHDVRTLLRRGATSGWAEVDFESGDARRYRARWSVRRARGATTGSLQDQQLTLAAIDRPPHSRGSAAHPGGAGVIDLPPHSQGSAAHPGTPWKSLTRDGARVIDGSERLGGTKTETLKAIQQRLGLTFDQFRRSALLAQGDFAAFLRADGKDRSELLERMTGTEIYSKLSIAAHQRAALAEQRLRDYRGAALAIAVLSDDARGNIEADLARARSARDAARQRFAAAEAYARWLAEAHGHRTALIAAEREYAAACNAARQAAPLRDELALLRRAEALRTTWSDATRLEAQCSAVASDVAIADAAVAAAERAARDAATSRSHIAALHAPVRAARIAARTVELPIPTPIPPAVQLDRIGVAAAEAATWLLERRGLASEVAAWPDVQAKLAQHRALGGAIDAATAALESHNHRRAALTANKDELATARDRAQQQLAVASEQTKRFPYDPSNALDAAGRAEDDARNRLHEISALSAIATRARNAADARAKCDAQLGQLERQASVDGERRIAIQRERDIALVLRDERSRAVSELRKVAGYSHARTELVPDEPCPLCGGTEHPWADRGAVDSLIEAGERDRAAAAARVDAATATLAELEANAAHCEAERAQTTARHAAALADAAQAEQAWRQQLAAIGELAIIADPNAPAANALVEELTEAARARLDEARRVRGEAVAAAKAFAAAQAQVQMCRIDLEACDGQLREIDRTIAGVDAELARCQGDHSAKTAQHQELGDHLENTCARWAAALPRSDRKRTKLDSTLLTALADDWTRRARQVAVAEAAFGAALSDIERATATSERARIEAAARRDELAKRQSDLAHERQRASAALDDACRTARLPRAQLHDLLADNAERLVTLAARVEEVARSVELGRVCVAERRRIVDDHERQRPIDPKLFAEQHATELATGDVGTESHASDVTTGCAAAEGRVSQAASRTTAAETVAAAMTTASADNHAAAVRVVPDMTGPASSEAHAAALATTIVANEAHATALAPAVTAAEQRAADLAAAATAAEQYAAKLAAAVTAAEQRAAELAAVLAGDADARERRDAALNTFAAAERAEEIDRVLGEVIGSHDGKLFRSFAQSLTLDSLLAVANSHLEELAPRYQLERVPKHDLELQVLDRDFGGEIRSVQSLSGGECFLVSLALALGLSSMSAHDVRVRTLLIDEGFGTLDPATLDSALAVLDELQATGRQVGIISHVPALLDRVHAHIRVAPRGGGKSRVVVPARTSGALVHTTS